jgi:hypothetical protein
MYIHFAYYFISPPLAEENGPEYVQAAALPIPGLKRGHLIFAQIAAILAQNRTL